MLVLFIIEFLWGTRIWPFGHGYKSGKIVDLCLEVSVNMIIIIIVAFTIVNIVIILFTIKMSFDNRRRHLFGKIRMNIYLLCLVVFSVFLIPVIVTSVVASAYALQNKKIDGKSIKCLNYIFDGARGTADWVSHQSAEKQKKI